MANRPVWAIFYGIASVAAVFGVQLGVPSAVGAWSLAAIVVVAAVLREWALAGNNAATDGGELRRVLARMTARNHASFQENLLTPWYVAKDGSDRAVWDYTTTVDDRNTLHWRRVEIISSAPAPDIATMAFTVKSGDSKLEAIRVVEQANLVVYVILFDPPLEAGANGTATLDWSIRFNWPGFWDPLRKDGEDSIALTPTHPGASAEIRVVLPPGWHAHEGKFLQLDPALGSWTCTDDNGRTTLAWHIPTPHPERHTAYVKVRK